MITIRQSTSSDGERVVEIWRRAVDATHDFLSAEDRAAIDREVQDFLPGMPLWLAVEGGTVLGFMGLSGSHLDALFIDPAHRGRGVGRLLVSHAVALERRLTTDVNEQNPQARGFYERLGFIAFGRSAIDDQGRPYPLIHMKLEPAEQEAGASW